MGKGIGILLLVLSVIGIIGLGISHYVVGYSYEKKIGSYMENAYNMNTPSRMKEQLLLAEQGMKNEGLTPEMYGAWIFKKPDNSMSYQYQHLDSIIERVDVVQKWYDEVYGNDSKSSETLGDVYEQKMDNLRQFIMEDTRSDWIAKDTWYINNHFFYYLFVWLVYLFLLIMGAIGFVLIAIYISGNE